MTFPQEAHSLQIGYQPALPPICHNGCAPLLMAIRKSIVLLHCRTGCHQAIDPQKESLFHNGQSLLDAFVVHRFSGSRR